MVRPRNPIELLELTGALADNLVRRRLPDPKSKPPIGNPLEHLPLAESATWCEFGANAPAGVLTAGDRRVLEMGLAPGREAPIEPARGQNGPTLRACMAKLGALPASRRGASGQQPGT